MAALRLMASVKEARDTVNRITTERQGRILVITFDRPAKYHGFTPEMGDQLIDAFEQLERDPDLFARVFPMDLRPQVHDIIRTWLFYTLLRAELEQLESARAAEHAIRDHQLPQAQEVVQLTLAGYRLGRFPYRELALAQQQAFEFELRRLDAALSYHLSRVELERLIGSTLPSAPGPASH